MTKIKSGSCLQFFQAEMNVLLAIRSGIGKGN
jgi:hypothetical protein